MKINKVILTTTNNPLYYDFWNPLSKVFVEKFGIEPVLFCLGDENDFIHANLNENYGKINYIKYNKDFPIGFQSTWLLFWATKFFKNEICFIQGIDEVPLSKMFLFDKIYEFNENDYVMTIADAYNPNHWSIENSASPSGQHCAKGFTFNEIYGFENNFEEEIKKIIDSKIPHFWQECEGLWGLDETYFSYKLRNYKNQNIIKSLNNFGLMVDRRIECYRNQEPDYDLNKLKEGWYSQAHLCRPYNQHSDWIEKLFNNIPKYI